MDRVTLGVEFVPPQEFNSKEWWLPLRPGLQWFYHSTRRRPARTGQVELMTVDADLKRLVSELARRGLTTHASCAGHAVSEGGTKRLFAQLVGDISTVRAEGLPVRNVETGEVLLWQNSHQRLPWTDAAQLQGHLEDHELVGCLGISGGEAALIGIARKLNAMEGVSVEARDGILWVWVQRPTLTAQQRTWALVTERVCNESVR